MGRAIVRHPKAFLFDEPLSNLDAKLRTHMRSEIRQLHQKLGATSVYVTHDQIEAMTLADRIVVMNGGRIEQLGTPIELFDTPQTTFVAGFIGAPTMNFVTGQITVKSGGDVVLTEAQSGAEIALPLTYGRHNGVAATVGIRPQHVSVRTVQGGGTPLQATVQLVEQTGCETNILLDLLGREFSVQTRDRMEVALGSTVALECPAEQLHVFDTTSGIRLA